jgi:tRNA(adenine34) deaminase
MQIMRLALDAARSSDTDVPVGAVLLNAEGKLVASSSNAKEESQDVTAHAEILAVRQAAKYTGDWRLEGLTLAVTLEPCVMCAGAIREARVSRVIFGAWDQKIGAGGSAYDILRDSRLGRVPEVIGGVLAKECSEVLGDFFQRRRLD